jgi:hypothetical protein
MSNEEEGFGLPHESPFEAIRREDEDGHEYWSARDLAKILGYATSFRNFQKAIKKAEEACQNSGQTVPDHFAHVRNMVNIGSGAKRGVEDIQLSRYACYLLVQNSDPEKQMLHSGKPILRCRLDARKWQMNWQLFRKTSYACCGVPKCQFIMCSWRKRHSRAE